jgi:hypothetical protein
MRAFKFITGHVIFKLRCHQIYELKITHIYLDNKTPKSYENQQQSYP